MLNAKNNLEEPSRMSVESHSGQDYTSGKALEKSQHLSRNQDMTQSNTMFNNNRQSKKRYTDLRRDHFESTKFLNRPANVFQKPEMDYSNPYVFSKKYYDSKKRPVSTYESSNRKAIKSEARKFVNRINLKQEYMLKCLRERNFQKLAHSSYVYLKLDVTFFCTIIL